MSAPVTFSWESDWEKAPVFFRLRIVKCPDCGLYRYETFTGQPHGARWARRDGRDVKVDCVGRVVPGISSPNKEQ